MSQTIRAVHPTPDVAKGVAYWEDVPATVDGVLGGYGNGTLPRVDALGSRTFLLRTLPYLSATPSPAFNGVPRQWMAERLEQRGGKGTTVTRALDCGAGVGRVTEHVLLPLVDEVHLVEPVAKFLQEAKKQSVNWHPMKQTLETSPFHARKAVYFHISTLQGFPVARPQTCQDTSEPIAPTFMDETMTPIGTEEVVYDIVLCQWCLQHLSESDLVTFLKQAKTTLRPPKPASDPTLEWNGGVIFVKENVCRDGEDGSEYTWYDDEDHSVTRSRQVYLRLFAEAGLTVVRSEVQQGFPPELFEVHMWALR
ncbi:N-terminal protein N-methyltransferase [Malassezia pachydermatis]|uniref:Alpha N-terminal protein methyltransferase 1 n=1 Tax=Malassezia pachydermatis TaxID=77020 RepID=A0A0M8MP98_9BASI|nr:domain membrane protein [Malassezia pachydermatis]KOS16496.1 domain membrane protein [Malassezia pachydermatis]